MKINALALFKLGILAVLISCESQGNQDDIIYSALNTEYVLIRNLDILRNSDDEISNHVDSILNGLIDTEFISTGQKNFLLDQDNEFDVGFEIIDLNLFNPNGLPESFDSLAARIVPITIEFLDSSTYGYPDALDANTRITERGNWTSRTGVLGTFMNAGQFQGQGEKFLGIRIPAGEDFKYGWIRIYCSQHS
ncbi:MAG: hypothetical protein ACP5E3_11495, partial [Bacteroidales bacterium]